MIDFIKPGGKLNPHSEVLQWALRSDENLAAFSAALQNAALQHLDCSPQTPLGAAWVQHPPYRGCSAHCSATPTGNKEGRCSPLAGLQENGSGDDD